MDRLRNRDPRPPPLRGRINRHSNLHSHLLQKSQNPCPGVLRESSHYRWITAIVSPRAPGSSHGTVTDKNPMDIPGITPVILGVADTALKKAYIKSFRYVWLSSIAFGGWRFFVRWGRRM